MKSFSSQIVRGFLASSFILGSYVTLGCGIDKGQKLTPSQSNQKSDAGSAKKTPVNKDGTPLDFHGEFIGVASCGWFTAEGVQMTRTRDLSWMPKGSKNTVPFHKLPLTAAAIDYMISVSGTFGCFILDPDTGLADEFNITLVDSTVVEREVCGTLYQPMGSAGGFALEEELIKEKDGSVHLKHALGEADGVIPILSALDPGTKVCMLRHNYMADEVFEQLKVQHQNHYESMIGAPGSSLKSVSDIKAFPDLSTKDRTIDVWKK